MNAPTRLALFAVAVMLTFAGAFAVGATVGPDRSDVRPPGQEVEQEVEHGVEQGVEEERDHGDA